MKRLRFFVFVFAALATHLSIAQEVTFQGFVERGPGTTKTEEVTGEVWFVSGFDDNDEFAYDSETFRIPAGHSKGSYSKTVPWSLADRAAGYLYIAVRCMTNCDKDNIYPYWLYYQENGETIDWPNWQKFGLDSRDDAYIANLTLRHHQDFVKGIVELPDGMVAETDIEVDLIANYRWGSGYNWWLRQSSKKVVIPQGKRNTQFTLALDLELARWGLFVGFQCDSLACQNHGLTKHGWLGNTDDNESTLEMVTALASATDRLYADDHLIESGVLPKHFSLPVPLTLSENILLPVQVERSMKTTSSPQIKGRIIVFKMEAQIECYDENFMHIRWDGLKPCYLDNADSLRSMNKFRVKVSESHFIINQNASSAAVDIMVEPLKQSQHSVNSQLNDGETTADHQYLSVVCDEGCEGLKSGNPNYYLGTHRSFLGLSENSAHEFYFTASFLDSEIVLPLQLNKTMPWLIELLLEEE